MKMVQLINELSKYWKAWENYFKNTKQMDIFQENHQEQRELNLNKTEKEFQTCCEVKKTKDPQGFEIIKEKKQKYFDKN